MKKRLIFCLFMGFIIYSLGIFIGGKSGLLAMKNLRTFQTEIQQNIDDIKEINTILNIRLEGLQTDPETIKLQARRIGLFENDESLIYVKGWQLNHSYYYPGSPLKNYTPGQVNKELLFLLSLFISISFFLISLFFYAYKNPERTPNPPFSS